MSGLPLGRVTHQGTPSRTPFPGRQLSCIWLAWLPKIAPLKLCAFRPFVLLIGCCLFLFRFTSPPVRGILEVTQPFNGSHNVANLTQPRTQAPFPLNIQGDKTCINAGITSAFCSFRAGPTGPCPKRDGCAAFMHGSFQPHRHLGRRGGIGNSLDCGDWHIFGAWEPCQPIAALPWRKRHSPHGPPPTATSPVRPAEPPQCLESRWKDLAALAGQWTGDR